MTGGIASEDGDLWCMNHQELNWRSADWEAFPDSPPVRYLAAAAFLKSMISQDLRPHLVRRPSMDANE